MEKNTEKQEIGSSSERENCVEIKGDKTNENPLITGRLLITGDTHGDQGAMTNSEKATASLLLEISDTSS